MRIRKNTNGKEQERESARECDSIGETNSYPIGKTNTRFLIRALLLLRSFTRMHNAQADGSNSAHWSTSFSNAIYLHAIVGSNPPRAMLKFENDMYSFEHKDPTQNRSGIHTCMHTRIDTRTHSYMHTFIHARIRDIHWLTCTANSPLPKIRHNGKLKMPRYKSKLDQLYCLNLYREIP